MIRLPALSWAFLATALAAAVSLPARAQGGASETIVERGVMGVKSANVFAPKYKERLSTYEDQIKMGLTKGWLTQTQADRFRSELERLRKLDAECAAKSYAEPGLSNLDKQFTKFNMDFSRAGNKPFSAPAPAAVPSRSDTAPADAHTARPESRRSESK